MKKKLRGGVKYYSHASATRWINNTFNQIINMDMCIAPGLIVGGMCCITFFNTKKNKVHDYDDERPRKMTPYEYQIYCAHMNIYGGHNK